MSLLHTINSWICPHCHASSNHAVHAAAAERHRKSSQGHGGWEENPNRIQAFAVCGDCRQPSVFVLKPKTSVRQPAPMVQSVHSHLLFLNRLRTMEVIFEGSSSRGERRFTVPDTSTGTALNPYYEVIEQYPKSAVQRPEADMLPGAINNVFDEMQHQMGQPRYLAIACRRMLEATCKDRLGDDKGNLASKIDRLHKEGLITEDMRSWAHTLRDIMNASVHEEEAPSLDKARELYDFCRLLADLLFVFPQRIERMRKPA